MITVQKKNLDLAQLLNRPDYDYPRIYPVKNLNMDNFTP